MRLAQNCTTENTGSDTHRSHVEVCLDKPPAEKASHPRWVRTEAGHRLSHPPAFQIRALWSVIWASQVKEGVARQQRRGGDSGFQPPWAEGGGVAETQVRERDHLATSGWEGQPQGWEDCLPAPPPIPELGIPPPTTQVPPSPCRPPDAREGQQTALTGTLALSSTTLQGGSSS